MKKKVALLAILFISSAYSFSQTVETLQTVTANGSVTDRQITVGSPQAGPMYTGRQIGSGYAYTNPYGAVFYAKSDALVSEYAYLFAGYYGTNADLGSGTNSFYVRGDGQGYFAGNLGIGIASPAYKLDVAGDSRFYNISGDGQIKTRGSNATLAFQNRSNNAKTWQWFADGSNAYLYSNTYNGNIISVNESGTVSVANNFFVTGNTTTVSTYPLDATAYARANFSAQVNSEDYANGARPGYGFHASGYYGGYLYQNGYNDYRIREASGDDYNLWTARNFNPANYFPFTGGNITGDVAIGTTASQKQLDVNGVIKTRKVKVTATDWADYVFDSTYQLTPLHQVEAYIQANKHLPDVPSAVEISKEGIDLGDNQAVLLKKIEELTLYIIQQQKKMEDQEKRLKELEAKMK